MEKAPQVITAKVTKTTNVLIKAHSNAIDLHTPLFAVNWFSTKKAWMYSLYNKLAGKKVKSIGGRPIFKGMVTQTLSGDSELKRDMLLIVRYPSGHHFKKLMENTFFKLVSVLRTKAVKKFTFGFSQPLALEEQPNVKDHRFAVHHFKHTSFTASILQDLEALLAPTEIRLFYFGQLVADLVVERQGTEQHVPCLMHGVIIYEATGLAHLEDFLHAEAYQNFSKQFQTSYVGLLHRVI